MAWRCREITGGPSEADALLGFPRAQGKLPLPLAGRDWPWTARYRKLGLTNAERINQHC
jgi:hypothetical protein